MATTKKAAAKKSGSTTKSAAKKKAKKKKVRRPAFTKAEVRRIGEAVEAKLGDDMADRVITVLSDPGVTQVPNP